MSRELFTTAEMSSLTVAAHLGIEIADARATRRWTLRALASRAGISASRLHEIEHGSAATLETYDALAHALGREMHADLIDPRRRANTQRLEDPVHAAMGERVAARMAAHGFQVAIDEPYQHFQFAGSADVLAWTPDVRHLLHVENRTRFPNLQEAAGSYNAKRRYLAAVMTERLGNGSRRRGFDSVTHVMAGLWSAEVIHSVRMRPATFAALCPDGDAAFGAWWSGASPPPGVTSAFLLLDPAALGRHATHATLTDTTRPRYRGYADAAEAIARPRISRGAASRS